MDFSEIKLPSNKKFGFFFALVFTFGAAYFYFNGAVTWVYCFSSAGAIFFVVTIVKADLLLPLNKLWIRFGLLLGMIVSPIVLGLIFFGIFTPTAFLMRLSGRDELRLKLNKKPSHWISRSEAIQSGSFSNQF